jgi:hypothetical protein
VNKPVPRILSLVVALLLWHAPAARADFSVAGVRLGDTRDALVGRLPVKCYVRWDGQQVTAEQCLTDATTLDDPVFAGCVASFHVDPKSRRIVSLSIEIPKERIGDAVNGLMAKHGQARTGQSIMAKKKGARGDALVWDVHPVRVVVDMYPTDSITFIAVVIGMGGR